MQYDWKVHRFFSDAPEIVDKAAAIDAIHRTSGPDAATWIPADCERELYELFNGVPPKWAAFDSWADDRMNRGIYDTVFGPLAIPAPPAELLEYATLASIRVAGKAGGIAKMGRSKLDAIAAVETHLPSEVLTGLRNEGRLRWRRYELLPALMTRFRVLHHAISAIICTARYLVLLAEFGDCCAVWSSANDSTTCTECRALESTKAFPAYELQNSLLNTPPRHPGCRCTIMSDLGT